MSKLFNFKCKYDLSFLLKPLVLLSFSSLFFYGIKVLGFSNSDNIMMFCVITVIFVSFIRNIDDLKKILIFAFLLFLFFVFRICLYDKLISFLAKICQNSGLKFGFFNVILDTFGLNDFENLIYHTSYGGNKFIDGEIVSGAVDIFKAKKGTEECSIFLSGKYLTLFSALGIALSFQKNKIEVLVITIISIITGDLNILLLTLLLIFTPFYFVLILFNFVSFFISNFVNLNSGFYFNGSLFEMIIQRNNLVYLFAIGIFICAVSYYFSRLVNEKIT